MFNLCWLECLLYFTFFLYFKVDDAYKTSSVGDDFVSTNVISVARDRGLKPEGVLVNLTVQLTGEKPANEEFLKEELANSLEAASSELSLSNASVSPIIQRVEDVQGKLQTSYFKSITNLVVRVHLKKTTVDLIETFCQQCCHFSFVDCTEESC